MMNVKLTKFADCAALVIDVAHRPGQSRSRYKAPACIRQSFRDARTHEN